MIAVVVFLMAAVVVVLVGPRMARTADGLAEATGMGGALFGVIFLSLATDLPEVTLTPAAVLSGTPKIAVGGLLGSATAQLVLIAVVDVVFRKGKLASLASLRTTLGQCALMMSVLAVPLIVAAGNPTLGRFGLGTVLLPAAYVGMLVAIRDIDPDEETSLPVGDDSGGSESEPAPDPVRSLWLRFAVFAALLAGAGIALEYSTETIGSAIGLGETAAGALLAGVVTSLPELVTALSAVRQGAFDLAVGDLVGSSALDVALLAWADLFYTDGSVFDLLGPPELALIGVALAVVTLLVVRLARGEQSGRPRVALESYLTLVVYIGGAAILVIAGG